MKTNTIKTITFIGIEEPNLGSVYDICLSVIASLTHAVFLAHVRAFEHVHCM